MKRPVAMPMKNGTPDQEGFRAPRAFAADVVPDLIEAIDPITDGQPDPETLVPERPRRSWLWRLLWGTGAALASLALGLAIDRLIRDLFASAPWLGYVGLGVLALFVIALIAVIAREVLSLSRLNELDALRKRAAGVLVTDNLARGRSVLRELKEVYAARPDLSRARAAIEDNEPALFDGREYINLGERLLMVPLDAKARALTAASARRVALVTAISPRALVDIAFVTFESIRLGGAIARLYGARPGVFGTWRLVGAILSHLAVTGGLVLTDGVVEQLVGQGLAARLSARLGEGLVNGLMTVRVGIAAMRVVRPLPFTTQPQPMVKDFIQDLTKLTKTGT